MAPESRDAGSTLGPQENLAALGPGEAIILMALIYFAYGTLCSGPHFRFDRFNPHSMCAVHALCRFLCTWVSHFKYQSVTELWESTRDAVGQVRGQRLFRFSACFGLPASLGVPASQCLPIVIYNLKEKDILKSEVRDWDNFLLPACSPSFLFSAKKKLLRKKTFPNRRSDIVLQRHFSQLPSLSACLSACLLGKPLGTNYAVF